MKETKVQITPTCHFELVEFETFPTTLTLDYTEHSPAHGYSDRETSIDIDKEQARQIIALLQKFVDGGNSETCPVCGIVDQEPFGVDGHKNGADCPMKKHS